MKFRRIGKTCKSSKSVPQCAENRTAFGVAPHCPSPAKKPEFFVACTAKIAYFPQNRPTL